MKLNRIVIYMLQNGRITAENAMPVCGAAAGSACG
jgi:hypothetical protein